MSMVEWTQSEIKQIREEMKQWAEDIITLLGMKEEVIMTEIREMSEHFKEEIADLKRRMERLEDGFRIPRLPTSAGSPPTRSVEVVDAISKIEIPERALDELLNMQFDAVSLQANSTFLPAPVKEEESADPNS